MYLKSLGTKSSVMLCALLCLVSEFDSFSTPWTVAPPGLSVHGILQARILEWAAVSFSRESSQPRDWTRVSWIGRQNLYWRAIKEAHDLLTKVKNTFKEKI